MLSFHLSTQLVPLFPPFLVERKAEPLHCPLPREPLAQGGHWDGAEGEQAPFLRFAPLSVPVPQANPAPLDGDLSAWPGWAQRRLRPCPVAPGRRLPGLQPAPALSPRYWLPALVSLIYPSKYTLCWRPFLPCFHPFLRNRQARSERRFCRLLADGRAAS